MNHINIFLNSKVENNGALAWIGDKGLTPFRYLFNGNTIRIQHHNSEQEIEIHHVASFPRGRHTKANGHLNSSLTGTIKTALSIVFLIPGLLIGTAFKGSAYLFSEVRKNHSLAKEHFTPINRVTPIDREIGSANERIETIEDLYRAFEELSNSDPKNRPIGRLTIYGNDLTIRLEDHPIFKFLPKNEFTIFDGFRITAPRNFTHFNQHFTVVSLPPGQVRRSIMGK